MEAGRLLDSPRPWEDAGGNPRVNCSYISQGPLRLANRENGAQKDHVTHLKKQPNAQLDSEPRFSGSLPSALSPKLLPS